MTNEGSNTKLPKSVAEAVYIILTKHGPWALGCTVLSVAFYYFALEPNKKDRDLYAETLRDSVAEQTASASVQAAAAAKQADSMESIATSNQGISGAVAAQMVTLDRINQQMDAAEKLRALAMETMGVFAAEVRGDHPEQSEKLDRLLEKSSEILEEVKKN